MKSTPATKKTFDFKKFIHNDNVVGHIFAAPFITSLSTLIIFSKLISSFGFISLPFESKILIHPPRSAKNLKITYLLLNAPYLFIILLRIILWDQKRQSL